jgi:ligand-binding sensor domain-containing protein
MMNNKSSSGLCNLKYFLKAVLLFIAGILQAQQPYLRSVASIEDFGEGKINTLYQDREGFVWIGATSGIYRFDGSDFFAVELDDSILNKSVTSIFGDAHNNLWLGFEDGRILSYDRFRVNAFTPQGKLPEHKITAIDEGKAGTLWFGTSGEGIYFLQNGVLSNVNSSSGLSDDFIYCMLASDDSAMWAGTDNGINICSIIGGRTSVRTLSVPEGLPDFIVQVLKKDEQGKIWIGMQDKGLCYYEPVKEKFVIPAGMENWKSGPVNNIFSSGNSVWILNPEAGITEYFTDSGILNPVTFMGASNLPRFHLMMGDLEGNIWLANGSNIFISMGPAIEFLNEAEGHSFQNIHALAADYENNIWFANDEGIFCFQWDPDLTKRKIRFYPIKNFPEINKVMSLYRDNWGFLWIGTFGNGLIRFDPFAGRKIRITQKDGLLNGNILSIRGSATELWLATLGGAFKCNLDIKLSDFYFIPEFESFGRDEGLSNNYIYNLFIDKNGRVWFATDGSGVCLYSDHEFRNIGQNSDFANKIIYSVTAGPDGKVWMNIAKDGLYCYNGNNITRTLHDKEHKNLSFSGIVVNHKNEVVMAYDKGIDVLNTLSGAIAHYESNAGLIEINPDLNTLALDSTGAVWIGTSKGIIRYSPLSGKVWDRTQSRITDVKLYLQKTDFRERNVFKYSENHISFSYAGLWYQYPGQVEYLIKLEGHDLDWIRTKNKNVIYSNLPHGNYTFKVKSALYENFNGASESDYSFTIQRPFWLSAWFFIFCSGIVISSVYYYIRLREKRLRRKQEALREKIRFQFENLRSQINPHFLFNSFSTLISLIDYDKDSAIEYVEELSNLFRNVLEFKDLDVIDLAQELKIINNYYRLQKKRYGNNLHLEISNTPDMEQIKIPPMTLQLLVENAIKHNVVSKENPLQIHIFADDESRYLFIDNNLQEKTDETASMGIGIRNIIERYNMLTDKKIQIIKTDKFFRVGLPFIN